MKRISTVVCLIGMICMLVACDSEKVAQDTPTPIAEETPLPTPKMETITVFTIDPTAMTLLPSRVKKNEDDDSVEYITQLVADNLEDDEIRVSDAYLEGDRAIIVFDSEAKPLKNCTADMEALILDCFSSSILDNVDGCREVVFRSDKGKYSSDNLTLGEDEAYASE